MAKRVIWTDEAKADIRAIDRQPALRILHRLTRFLADGKGDAKRLQKIDPPEFRLRIGDYRVRYYDHGEHIEIIAVKHRREAYR